MTEWNNIEFKIAVLIVSYRNLADVSKCLQALNKQTYSNFEVVICENGGEVFSDYIMEMLESKLVFDRPVAVISAPYNVGFAGAVNLCIKSAVNASAWWILNPDTEPHPDALKELLIELENGRLDAVGSTLLRPDGRIQSQGGIWEPLIGRAVSIGYGRSVGSGISHTRVLKLQNYLNGASILINSRFINTVGLMREDYFLYCEEVEWFLRAKDRDLKIGYANKSIVAHNQGSTTGAGGAITRRSRLSVYLTARNSILLMYDTKQNAMPVCACFSLFYLILKYGKSLAFKQLVFAADGWFSGLRNLRGRPKWLAE